MAKSTALVLSDIHIPFENTSALNQAIAIGKKRNVNTIILNGDIIDFHSISRFDKDPKRRDLKGEIDKTRQFLAKLRKTFPRARIIYKEGNHEQRLIKYVWANAGEFADMPELTLQSLLWFSKYRILYSPASEVINLADLAVIHGQEIKGTLSTFPARTAYQAAKTNILFGHCHRQSSYVTRDITGKVYNSYSTGCLCNLKADYSQFNEWTTGFALVTLKSGCASVELINL